jgi:hypothetical protein
MTSKKRRYYCHRRAVRVNYTQWRDDHSLYLSASVFKGRKAHVLDGQDRMSLCVWIKERAVSFSPLLTIRETGD